MRLRAQVARATGATRHWVGRPDAPGGEQPVSIPSYVEIEERADGTAFLFYLGADGKCLADTWHTTVGDAKRQAALEFATTEDDWRDVSN